MAVRWRLAVTEDCIGSGLCIGSSADHFQLVDGFSQPVTAEVEPGHDVYDIAFQCPVEAIVLTDAETGEPVLADPVAARVYGQQRA
ncbi:ferredoxin [Actinomadura rugatobispora]|uniref:Ferredoxin n=1 Tax=Actinomadura rugatobispora TaxID=1994 RepID=A0ABW1A996_9ACTN|nr:hypothetical protein GCM10010200_001120 [Actinomadura rugatobispora]